jgi:HTH-type transcriptional regulator/antitoxin MqsA
VTIFPSTCGACGGTVSVSHDALSLELRGETIVVPDLEHAVCMQCGEAFLDLKEAETLQREAIRRSKQTKGLLTPDEVRALRQSLGLSQAGFEKLLGVGPKTVVRWEKGTVFQSATADRLMRLIRAMPEVIGVLRSGELRASPMPSATT